MLSGSAERSDWSNSEILQMHVVCQIGEKSWRSIASNFKICSYDELHGAAVYRLSARVCTIYRP